jgi:hypothetical protein
MEAETDRLAGFHTGTSPHIDSAYVNNMAVRLHEGIHQNIFSETPDGMLHFLLLQLRRRSEDERSIATLSRATARPLNGSRFAHEAAATFLGVQSLFTEAERSKTVLSFTDEYRNYYAFFDGLISRSFKSTFAKYAIAWAFSRWSFCSTRAERVATVGDLDDDDVWQIPGPTERLLALGSALTRLGAAYFRAHIIAAVQATFRAESLKWFDIDDEAEWALRANSEDGQRADGAFIKACEGFALQHGDLPTTTRFALPVFLDDLSALVDMRWYSPAELLEKDGHEIPGDIARHQARRNYPPL